MKHRFKAPRQFIDMIPEGFHRWGMISCHFPVGRYPQLYDEVELSDSEAQKVLDRRAKMRGIDRSALRTEERRRNEEAREAAEHERRRKEFQAEWLLRFRQQADEEQAKEEHGEMGSQWSDFPQHASISLHPMVGTAVLTVLQYPFEPTNPVRDVGPIRADFEHLPFREGALVSIERRDTGGLEARVRPRKWFQQ